MPVALITLRAYASWMPDRPEGYTHYRTGEHDADDRRARFYRANQAEPTAVFTPRVQQVILEAALAAAEPQSFELYAASTDDSHAHFLIAWRDARRMEQLRTSLKFSLSRHLNEAVEHRSWFTRGGQVRSVQDLEHLTTLACEYLPSHRGLTYVCERFRGQVLLEATGSGKSCGGANAGTGISRVKMPNEVTPASRCDAVEESNHG